MIKMIKIVGVVCLMLNNFIVNGQKMKQKEEFEIIKKEDAHSLIKQYDGQLSKELSHEPISVYLLNNGRALVFLSHKKTAAYYYDSTKLKDPYKEDEILANQDFFANFEENRKATIRYIDSLYPAKDIDTFYKDSNTKRQSDFLHKVLLKDKNHISFRNGMIFIGEIINQVNGFEWRIEKKIDIRVNKKIIEPYLYDPINNKKVYTHYFKELIEYNSGSRKKIYL